ncbi:hypothetical protein MUK42_11205, partial [Musa troglodytarum]
MTNTAMEEDPHSNVSSSRERYAEFMKDSCCARYFLGPNPSIARFVYALIFLVTCLLAWTVRDYGRNALSELESWSSSLRACFLPACHCNHTISLLLCRTQSAFLMIQLISVISFITWLNDCCQSEKYAKRCFSCNLNILFITMTLVLLQLMILTSMHAKVKAGFLSPGLMGMYIVYLCWSAIRSEPQTEICNKKAEVATSADWLTIVSFVIAVLAIVIATFSTGIDSKCFQFKKTEAESEDDVPYGYGFFHFVFAMGAMYFAMLFVGWNAHNTMQKCIFFLGLSNHLVRAVVIVIEIGRLFH